MKKIGAYLPGAYEEVVDVVDAYVLTEKVSCKAVSSIIIDSSEKMANILRLHRINDIWEMTAEILYWWGVTTQIWIVLLLGRTASEIFLNQSEAPFAWNKAPSDFW